MPTIAMAHPAAAYSNVFLTPSIWQVCLPAVHAGPSPVVVNDIAPECILNDY
jgi:hypothetical protein